MNPMNPMNTAYSYHPQTSAFVGEVRFSVDPLDGTARPPAFATLTPPPATGQKEVAIWEGEAWSVTPDHRGAQYWLADGTHHIIAAIGEVPPDGARDTAPPMPRADQRKAALSRVDETHATYLVTLTGGATVAERDTWKVKEEAARAFEAGKASAGQAAMLATEAAGAGIPQAELAAQIIANAEAFLANIGVAAGLRAKGRAAILAATDETVPLAEVADRIRSAFAQLDLELTAS